MRIAILGIESSHVDQFVELINSHPQHELVGIGIVTQEPLSPQDLATATTRLEQLNQSNGSMGTEQDPPVFFGTAQDIARALTAPASSSTGHLAQNDSRPGTAHNTSSAKGLDAVVIADRLSAHHASHARPFIERGLAVFVDKPFTSTIEQAQALLALANTHGASVTSFSALRFAPLVVQHSRAILERPIMPCATVVGSFSQHSPFGADFYLVHCAEIAVTLLGGTYDSVTHSYDAGVLTAVITGTGAHGARTVQIQAFEESVHGYQPHALAHNGHCAQPIPLPALYLKPGFDLWLDSLAGESSSAEPSLKLPDHTQMLACVELTQELLAALPVAQTA